MWEERGRGEDVGGEREGRGCGRREGGGRMWEESEKGGVETSKEGSQTCVQLPYIHKEVLNRNEYQWSHAHSYTSAI